jgi:thioredoxin reductase (NADPH)
MTDVLIVGGGPAGVSAAVYLKRYRKDVSIVMKDRGTLGTAGTIENYYGFPEPIDGADLFDLGIEQAKHMDIPVHEEEVLNIESSFGGDFTVKTTEGEHQARAVLLATGSNRAKLRVEGFNAYEGKGISHCAVCDGFIYRDKTIGIVGSKKYMAEEFEVLKNFTDDLIVFTNGEELTVDVDAKEVVDSPLTKITGDEKIRTVHTEDGSHDVDALFIAMGTPSASDFALKMGAFVEKNHIVVDDDYMTNVPGLFAAGDCIGGWLQIAKAVNDGGMAATAINKFLRKKSSE